MADIVYRIDKRDSDRIQILRLIFCLLVVMLHSYNAGDWAAQAPVRWLERAESALSYAVGDCAVPGFFILSAVLLYKKEFSWGENIRRKIRALAVPYLLLNTVWILIYFIAQQIPGLRGLFTRPESLVAGWSAYDWADAYLGLSGYPAARHLWFLRDLFVLNLLAKALKALIDRLPVLWLLCLAAAMAFQFDTGLFCLSRTALVSFSLGYYLVKYDLHFDRLDRVSPLLLGLLYGLSIAACGGERGGPLQILAGLLFWARLSGCLLRWREPILRLARYNFPIYLFHSPPLGHLRDIESRYLPPSNWGYGLGYLLNPLIICLCCLALALFLSRFMPGLYGLLTGDRGAGVRQTEARR